MNETPADNAVLRALAAAWDLANGIYLRGALRPPALALSEGTNALGTWHGASRTLSIARTLVYERPWREVNEVLRHEMAHQYVDEVLGIRDERPHGGAFNAACRRLGVDPVASGPIRTLDVDDPRARTVAKIHKLLALAASPNRNEAEAAMRAARRRMLEHHVAGVPLADTRYLAREVGEVRSRFSSHERVLAGLLGEHFFVRPIWIQTYRVAEDLAGSVLEISGRPEDVDVAAYVHAFLLDTSERLWRDHRRTQGGGDRDRRRYLAGVMQGFHEKLVAERPSERAAGLVWVGDPALDAFVERQHPRLRKSSYRIDPNDGFEEGRRAGRSIVLHRGVAAGPSDQAPRRLTRQDD